MRRRQYPEGASEMLRALGALRAGAISFNEFERRTRRDWDRIAKELHGRWQLPPAVSVDDVRQELLLAIVIRKASSGWQNLLEKWDPRFRTPLDEYIVWNARVAAARWIHLQRGARRNREEGDVAGKIKSKFYPVVSSLGKESDRSDSLREVAVRGDQEERVILSQELPAAIQRAQGTCRALDAARLEIASSIRRSDGDTRRLLLGELKLVTRQLKAPKQVIETASELLELRERIGTQVSEKSARPTVAGMVRVQESAGVN